MSVQRWAIIVDNALRGVTEVRKVAARDGEWVEYQAHAAEVARLRGALEDGSELARRVVEFARIDEKRRIPCRYCRSLPGTLHVMCAVPLARKIIDTALAPAARKEPS